MVAFLFTFVGLDVGELVCLLLLFFLVIHLALKRLTAHKANHGFFHSLSGVILMRLDRVCILFSSWSSP